MAEGGSIENGSRGDLNQEEGPELTRQKQQSSISAQGEERGERNVQKERSRRSSSLNSRELERSRRSSMVSRDTEEGIPAIIRSLTIPISNLIDKSTRDDPAIVANYFKYTSRLTSENVRGAVKKSLNPIERKVDT